MYGTINKTVGKATIKENPQALSQCETKVSSKPIFLAVPKILQLKS
jgi:hypothetical protein